MAKKAKSSLGITFWVALLVFLGLLYTANRVDLASILGNPESGDIVKLFGGDYNGGPDTGAADKEDSPAAPTERPAPAADVRKEAGPPVQAPAPPVKKEDPLRAKPAAQAPPAAPPAPGGEQAPKSGTPAAATAGRPGASAGPQAAVKPAGTEGRTREGVLYFIRLSEEGEITLAKTSREIRSSGAPLTDTLRTLAAGPTEKESGAGCTSLIPAESRLLSVTVQGGVAFVNFDENFRFNSFGREGYSGQLKQLVYTATEFPTIQAVQVLINGSKIDYLGSEGIYIGKPVGRKDV
jgi:hypothetical protein